MSSRGKIGNKKSETPAVHKTNDIPILDEVNDLIEKERTLLALKLLEQQREAQQWKSKYDHLVEKVVSVADTPSLGYVYVLYICIYVYTVYVYGFMYLYYYIYTCPPQVSARYRSCGSC